MEANREGPGIFVARQNIKGSSLCIGWLFRSENEPAIYYRNAELRYGEESEKVMAEIQWCHA